MKRAISAIVLCVLATGPTPVARAWTVEDPLYLRQPYTGRDVVTASKEPYTPYECVELSGDNNKRPAGKRPAGQ